MAKKGFIKDLNNIEILPITRGELILDSSGNLAFRSNEFLATDSLPGLMSKEDKAKLDKLNENSITDLVSATTDGLAPKIGTEAASTVATQTDEWVLTSTKGATPTWRKLPINAFLNYYRPILVDGTSLLGNNNTALNIAAGTNINLTTDAGKVTIHSNITDITGNAATADKLKNKVKLWGLEFDGSQSLSNTIIINNQHPYASKKTDGAVLGLMYLNGNNNLIIGQDVAKNTTSTYIFGHEVRLCYGATGTTSATGVKLETNGNVAIPNGLTIGSSTSDNGSYKLNVNGTARIVGTSTFDDNIHALKSIHVHNSKSYPLKISRMGEGKETTNVYQDDNGLVFDVTNDEKTSRVYWNFTATDIENSDGTDAKSGTLHFGINNSSKTYFAADEFLGNLNGKYINALTGYTKATTAADLVETDTLNIALGKLEYKADIAYSWYRSITLDDTDEIINKWDEVVDFVNGLEVDLTEEFVTRKTNLTITGVKTFLNGYSGEKIKLENGNIRSSLNEDGGWSRLLLFGNTSGDTSVSASFGVYGGGINTGPNRIHHVYIAHQDLNYSSATFKVYADRATILNNEIYHKGNLKNLSDLNDDVVSGKYLPLTGGTVTGPIEIKSTVSGNYNEGLRITCGSNNWAGITFGGTGLQGAPINGWFAALNPSDQFIISPNYSSNTAGLTLNARGDAKWRNNILLHTGNYSSTLDTRYYTETEVNNLLAKYLPLAGGDMNPDAKISFKIYGTRKLTIDGNNLIFNVSETSGGWAGGLLLNYNGTPVDVLTWRGEATTLSSISIGNIDINNLLHSGNYTSYLPILNSASTHATNASVIYAPSTAGTQGLILTSNGSGAPVWSNPATLSIGTANTIKIGTASSNTNYPVLFTTSTSANNTASVYIDSDNKITINPRTNTITAAYFNGILYLGYITPFNTVLPNINTVKDAKDLLVTYFSKIAEGVGANAIVSASVINNWNSESTTLYDSSEYSMIKIGGSYSGTTYGLWLLSSYADKRIGYVGRNNDVWSSIKWLATTEDIDSLKNYYWANIQISSSANTDTSPTFAHPTSKYLKFTNGTEVIGYVGRGSSNNNNNLYFLNYTNSDVGICTDNNTSHCIYLKTGGNVGIGTTNPGYKLEVNGTTLTSKLFINTSIQDHASPNSQCLVLYSSPVPSDSSLTLKNAPGIGFHVLSFSWGSLVFNGNFHFLADDHANYKLVYAKGFIKSNSSDSYVLLGGGGHKALSDFLLKSEIANQELSANLTTITKSLTVTADWMDTGIAYNNLPANGSYIVLVYVQANDSKGLMYSCYWSGVMTWYVTNPNSKTNDTETDEIILHRSGHAYHNTIYLRTVMTNSDSSLGLKLLIAANKNLGAAYTYTFKFKRII